jgi:hypothetical protein
MRRSHSHRGVDHRIVSEHRCWTYGVVANAWPQERFECDVANVQVGQIEVAGEGGAERTLEVLALRRRDPVSRDLAVVGSNLVHPPIDSVGREVEVHTLFDPIVVPRQLQRGVLIRHSRIAVDHQIGGWDPPPVRRHHLDRRSIHPHRRSFEMEPGGGSRCRGQSGRCRGSARSVVESGLPSR